MLRYLPLLGLGVVCIVGNSLLFWGFGLMSERMNKRVRDATFTNLIRQEIGWFDMHSLGTITSHLSDDAALIHAFTGEPIRTLTLNIASVAVGIILGLIFMWVSVLQNASCHSSVINTSPVSFQPFALLAILLLPFMVRQSISEVCRSVLSVIFELKLACYIGLRNRVGNAHLQRRRCGR